MVLLIISLYQRNTKSRTNIWNLALKMFNIIFSNQIHARFIAHNIMYYCNHSYKEECINYSESEQC